MSGETIGALNVPLSLDATPFALGAAQARTELASFQAQTNTAMAAVDRSFTRTMDSIGKRLESTRNLFGPFLAPLSAAGAIGFATSIIREIDDIASHARDLGITIDANMVENIDRSRNAVDRLWTEFKVGAADVASKIIDGFSILNKIGGGAAAPGPSITGALIAQMQSNNLSALDASNKAYERLLAKMKIEAELAAETADKRALDQMMIEAANKQLEIQNRSSVVILSNAQQARAVLGDVAAQIERAFNAIGLGQGQSILNERLADARAIAAHPPAVAKFDDVSESLQSAIERESRANRAFIDRTAAQTKYLDDLRAEVSIVGLLPKMREEELALLQARDRLGDKFVEQNETEIRQLIEQRQQAAELGDSFAKNQQDFADFLKNVETGGRATFANLFRAIVSDWEDALNKMIAEKAAQAIFGGAGIGNSLLNLIGLGDVTVNDVIALPTSVPGLAGGGVIPPGGMAIVGEHGPELAYGGSSGATIVPSGGSGGDIHIHVYGANGDADIRALVAEGIRQGLAAYDRGLPTRLAAISDDPHSR